MTTAASAPHGASDPFDHVEAFFAPYVEAFYSGDRAALDAMFEYPYVFSNADGVREVENSDLYRRVSDSFKASGCVTSRIDRLRKLRMGQDGALVMIDYSRLRADGSVMNTGSGGYLLRHRPDGWKLVGMLDSFGG